MKINQHIEDYLNAYRGMKEVDFAVMITGPWGCGKTYFIRQYLDDHCTPDEERQYLYISLNGVARTADIDMAIFQAAHPVLGSKLAVTASKVFKASLKAGLKIDLDVDHDGSADGDIGIDPLAGLSLAKFKLSTKGKLLVFDDLERCLLKPEEVLGYINAFVESKEAKVLVIGDEKHFGVATSADNRNNDDESDNSEGAISESEPAKYWMIKEKVVGKTFRLTERIEEVFDALVSKEIFPRTYELIVRNKNSIILMFQNISKETEKYNYRALKHCFRDFEYCYPTVDPSFHDNNDCMNHLFCVFLALDYELQLANISPEDFKPVDTVAAHARAMRKSENEKEKPSKLEIVLKRHNITISPLYPSLSNILLPIELWGTILKNEQVDKNAVSESIQNSTYFPERQAEWVTLWNWRRVEDADAAKALEEVQAKLKNFEYRSREVIAHVFSILKGLAELGVIEGNEDSILAEAKNYLTTLVDKKLLAVPEISLGYYWADSGSHGLGYWDSDSEFFRKLVKTINEAVVRADTEAKQSSAKERLQQLKDDPGAFFESIANGGKHYRDPILKYFDPLEFLDVLYQVPNEHKWRIGNTLKDRYRLYKDDLMDELPFIEAVSHELGERLNDMKQSVTPTTANMEYLKGELDKLIEFIRLAGSEDLQ